MPAPPSTGKPLLKLNRSMSTGKPSENLYPDRVAEVEFGVVKINAPEPAAGLALLAGIASVALLGRRGRNSR